MAYQQHVDDLHEEKSECNYCQFSNSFSIPSISFREPSIDLMSSAYPSYSRLSSPGHFSRPLASTPYHHTPSDTSTFSSPRAAQPGYISAYDELDYQMIEAGGWASKKGFMECHGLNIYEPGDFQEAKELLDEYGRVDTEVASENIPSSDTDSDYSRTPVHHWNCSEREEIEGRDYSDFISDGDDEERIAPSGDESSSLSESSVYAAFDKFSGFIDDGRDVQEDSDYSSDADSTDAIEYESEDDSCGSDDDDSNSVDQAVESWNCSLDEDSDDDDDDDYW